MPFRKRIPSQSDAEKPRAHIRALRWLTRRDYSVFELQTRLAAEGYSTAEIDDALTWLQDGQWQSDERFAGSLARRRAGAYGSRLIRAELEQHRVAGESISEALSAMEQTDAQRAWSWLEKRSRGAALTTENRARWFRALLARGFSPDDIKEAFRMLAEQRQDVWQSGASSEE